MKHDLEKIIELVCKNIDANIAELTELDAAIGDADHGVNMKRGCQAVYVERKNIAAQTLPEATKTIGNILLMNIGGASGPLYATMFLTLGKKLNDFPDDVTFANSMSQAVEAVKVRGRVEYGQKTLLDVLGPVLQILNTPNSSLANVRKVAASSAMKTIPMQAGRGRASFMGSRSVGHMDPGARSCQIIIESICDVLEDRI